MTWSYIYMHICMNFYTVYILTYFDNKKKPIVNLKKLVNHKGNYILYH